MESVCLYAIQVKEDGKYRVRLATTHPDKVGDILSKEALQQIVDKINDTERTGGEVGSFRSVSLYHDWVEKKNPKLDEAGFVIPGSAALAQIDDGHWAAEADVQVNEFYRGEISPKEIKYRIEKGSIGGMSIEWLPDETAVKTVSVGDKAYRFVQRIKEYVGQAFARARVIANPHAIIHYKEVEMYLNENQQTSQSMDEPQPVDAAPTKLDAEQALEETPSHTVTDLAHNPPVTEPAAEEAPAPSEPIAVEVVASKEVSTISTEPIAAIDVKQIVQSAEFKEVVESLIHVKSRSIKTKNSMEEAEMAEVPISVKEMNSALSGKQFDAIAFKEAVSSYFTENPHIDAQMRSTGIPFGEPTVKVKCDGTKLRILGNINVKGVLDTNSNSTTYTQSIVEFNDLYVPVLVDTFNNQTNLFGELRKVSHLMGGDQYGWRIKSDQKSGLSVDPDNATITTDAVAKQKIRTKICEYRVGVAVTDFVQHHARASMGDLLMIEVQARMKDLMRDLNADLFTEQVDSGNKVVGLEAVADSAGNTTLYGLTRSTTNRLAPDAAIDTYQAVGGALTTALLRGACRKVEVEGALRSNLRIVVNPAVRDKILELSASSLRYQGDPAMINLGFGVGNSAVQGAWDGVPMIVDSQCQNDAVFVVDFESYYFVVSRAPQIIGLAKVAAAESAYITMYGAAVYEQPRRIHMLDTLS